MKPDFPQPVYPQRTPRSPFLDLKLNPHPELPKSSPPQAPKPRAPPLAPFAQSRSAFLPGKKITNSAPGQGGSAPTWFMPALTKSKLGSPRGRTEADGTSRWPWRSRKKFRKASRTAVAEAGGGSDENGRRPRHLNRGDLRTARRSRRAAAAIDTAILTRGSNFTGSRGPAGIEGDVERKPRSLYSGPWR